jgi:hypothetical protein
LCKTAKATLDVLMHQTQLAKVAVLGAMLRRRWVLAFSLIAWVRGCCFLLELLSADAAEAAWNYCAPVVDYDGVRREVSSIFVDKAAEVQSLVAKLQKTQRAAEQALDKFGFSVDMVACAAAHPMQILSPGMRRRAQNRWGARVRRLVVGGAQVLMC